MDEDLVKGCLREKQDSTGMSISHILPFLHLPIYFTSILYTYRTTKLSDFRLSRSLLSLSFYSWLRPSISPDTWIASFESMKTVKQKQNESSKNLTAKI